MAKENMHHKKHDYYHEYFTHTYVTTEFINTPTKQPYCIDILTISIRSPLNL